MRFPRPPFSRGEHEETSSPAPRKVLFKRRDPGVETFRCGWTKDRSDTNPSAPGKRGPQWPCQAGTVTGSFCLVTGQAGEGLVPRPRGGVQNTARPHGDPRGPGDGHTHAVPSPRAGQRGLCHPASASCGRACHPSVPLSVVRRVRELGIKDSSGTIAFIRNSKVASNLGNRFFLPLPG